MTKIFIPEPQVGRLAGRGFGLRRPAGRKPVARPGGNQYVCAVPLVGSRLPAPVLPCARRTQHGIVNTRSLEPPPLELVIAVPADYEREEMDERFGRREAQWTPVTAVPWA